MFKKLMEKKPNVSDRKPQGSLDEQETDARNLKRCTNGTRFFAPNPESTSETNPLKVFSRYHRC